jgi:deazaflavin-dependent oxidoreductase (nitroreductase family)
MVRRSPRTTGRGPRGGDQNGDDDEVRLADHHLIEAQAGAGRADEQDRRTTMQEASPAEAGPAAGDPADEPFCYLTTVGRISGRHHTVEIWFARRGATVYLLSGDGDQADWVRNVGRQPRVTLRVGTVQWAGHARVVTDPDEDRLARQLVAGKYQPTYSGDLSTWRDTALPVAIDVAPARTRET